MNSQHLIDQTLFDIVCDSELLARELQPVLDSFVKKNLMTVVDDEFDQASVSGMEVRIDKLEIDLGDVPYLDYQNEMPKRLREALKSRLSEVERLLVSGKASNQGYVVKRRDEFDQLKFFLLHGYLPWYARVNSQAEMENLLRRGLAKAGGEFRHFLQHLDNKKSVLSRLVNQFPNSLLTQVFESVSPALAKSVNVYMASLAQKSILSGPVAFDLSQQVWLQMITTMLKADSTQLSAQQLFEQSLRDVLNHNDGVFDDFFHAVVETSATVSGDEFDVILGKVLRQLSNKTEATETPNAPGLSGSHQPAALDVLREKLINAIQAGDSSIIEPEWVLLIKNHKPLLEQALRKYGQQSLIRKKIAIGFTEAILQDILFVLEPVEYGFVISFIERPSLFSIKEDERSQYKSVTKVQLWEFSLSYLLVERGSRFNKKAYLYSLLSQMAVARCQSYAELLIHLSEYVAALPKSSSAVKQLTQLLSELTQEWKQNIKNNCAAEEKISENYHSYELLQLIVEDDVFNSSIDESAFNHNINVLIKQAPWLLNKLFIRLSENPKRLNKYLTAPMLRQLIVTYLKLSNGQRSVQSNEFLQSIDRFSGQVLDEKYFYRKVFLGLIGDRLIDFELLIAQCDQTYHGQHSQFKKEVEPKSIEQYTQMVATFLNSGSKFRDSETRSFIHAVEQLLSESTQAVKYLFENLLVGEARLSRLTHYLPEQLLARLVDVMVMHVSVRVVHNSGFSRRGELGRAIAAYAEKSEDKKNYYLKTLLGLTYEKPINFQIETKSMHNNIQEQALKDLHNNKTSDSRAENVVQRHGSAPYQEAYIKAFLTADSSPSAAEQQQFSHAIEQVLSQSSNSIRDILDCLHGRQTGILRLIEYLSEQLLSEVVSSSFGSATARMLYVAELLLSASSTGQLLSSSHHPERLKWHVVFAYLIEVGTVYNERLFLQRYIQALLKSSPLEGEEFHSALVRQLRRHSETFSTDISDAVINALTENDISEEPAVFYREDINVVEADVIDDEFTSQDEIYVANAGLVLVSPYLPRLFDLIGLTENRAFKTPEAANRAVHLLQFIVNESCSTPEYQLVLNKLLCGVKTSIPIGQKIDISAEESQQIEGLLQGIIQHWKALGNTSVTGLRESFLQREGKLQLKDEVWHLRVEEKAFDMLLDQIPWGFSTIKYPWMERVIYVEWR